jgi:hypothetical protein
MALSRSWQRIGTEVGRARVTGGQTTQVVTSDWTPHYILPSSPTVPAHPRSPFPDVFSDAQPAFQVNQRLQALQITASLPFQEVSIHLSVLCFKRASG